MSFKHIPLEKRREFSSKGGKARQALGLPNPFDDVRVAAKAGRKGGRNAAARKREIDEYPLWKRALIKAGRSFEE